jgi:hypothetical protein
MASLQRCARSGPEIGFQSALSVVMQHCSGSVGAPRDPEQGFRLNPSESNHIEVGNLGWVWRDNLDESDRQRAHLDCRPQMGSSSRSALAHNHEQYPGRGARGSSHA